MKARSQRLVRTDLDDAATKRLEAWFTAEAPPGQKVSRAKALRRLIGLGIAAVEQSVPRACSAARGAAPTATAEAGGGAL